MELRGHGNRWWEGRRNEIQSLDAESYGGKKEYWTGERRRRDNIDKG